MELKTMGNWVILSGFFKVRTWWYNWNFDDIIKKLNSSRLSGRWYWHSTKNLQCSILCHFQSERLNHPQIKIGFQGYPSHLVIPAKQLCSSTHPPTHCSVVVSILVPWPIPHCATAAATKLNCRLLIPASILLVHDLSMLSRAQPAASNFLPADPDENKTLFFSIAPSLYNLYMLQSFLLSDWIKWKMKLICVWLWQ